MTIPDPDAHAIASFRKFYTLLPRGNDLSLLILKLHLLVEEQVRAFVDERLQNKEALGLAKLECHQAICLAEALCSEGLHPNVWEAARKLNSLRNHIAHNLELKGVVDRMNHISRLIGVPKSMLNIEGKSAEEAAVENFSFGVSMLYNEVSLYVKASQGLSSPSCQSKMKPSGREVSHSSIYHQPNRSFNSDVNAPHCRRLTMALGIKNQPHFTEPSRVGTCFLCPRGMMDYTVYSFGNDGVMINGGQILPTLRL
ncbi:hypothetical protein ACH50O_20595 [Methylomonas sp. 2BW1-5-20]|uniref:hypothetical protein n=1 Tax=Methylomonas sp. 2BW1-5-20 TaxID=3376686 RepID=UPI00404E7CB3